MVNAWDLLQKLLRTQYPSSMQTTIEIRFDDTIHIERDDAGNWFARGTIKDIQIEHNKLFIIGEALESD